MLQRPLSYLLILLTLSSGFTRLYFYVGYELNKSYIATILCENISKPELMCSGKCYLVKKIKQAEKSHQKTTSKRFISDHFLITGSLFQSFIRGTDVYRIEPYRMYFSVNIHSVFHPPQA